VIHKKVGPSNADWGLGSWEYAVFSKPKAQRKTVTPYWPAMGGAKRTI